MYLHEFCFRRLPTHRRSAHRHFFHDPLILKSKFLPNVTPGPRYAAECKTNLQLDSFARSTKHQKIRYFAERFQLFQPNNRML